MRRSSAILLAGWALAAAAVAQPGGFKFSSPSPEEQADAQARAREQATVAAQLATPCREKIRHRKILVLVGESHDGVTTTAQSGFGPQVEAINAKLQQLGLQTFSAEQIRRQVAQEEVDAYFRNEPDRALSASTRLAAQYVLKGVIATQAFRNQAVGVNQVGITMDFTLADAAGRPVSTVHASDSSYAGRDVAGMALTLIQERADAVVAQLYGDWCRNAR